MGEASTRKVEDSEVEIEDLKKVEEELKECTTIEMEPIH